MAVAAWLVYLGVHFVVVPGWFVWRYRRSPYVWRRPRNLYDRTEAAYGFLVAGYTVAICSGPLPPPLFPVVALAAVVAGSGLIVWAVATLGGSWRIGQDERDTTCTYVSKGPYRFMQHPIYWGMTISASGQMLLTAGDVRGLVLFVGTLAYVLVQGRAESSRWRSRSRLAFSRDESRPV